MSDDARDATHYCSDGRDWPAPSIVVDEHRPPQRDLQTPVQASILDGAPIRLRAWYRNRLAREPLVERRAQVIVRDRNIL
jgi:hypothetical protein